MATITNSTGGQFNLTILGENTNTKEVDVYGLNITTSDPISFSADGLSSGNFEYTTQYYKNGNIAGQTRGNEVEPSGEFSFSFKEDFDYLAKKHIYGNSKNLITNFINGESFINKGDTINTIGTNGTTKSIYEMARLNEMNKPYRFLYYNEGAFIKKYGTADKETGYRASLKRNPFETTFNESHKTFSGEILTTSGRGQVNRMFAILAKGSVEFAEDISENKYTVTAKRGCDLFERNDFFTEVYVSPTSELKEMNELYVSAIVTKDMTTTIPNAKKDDLILYVQEDGTPKLAKYDGTTSWKEEKELSKLFKTGTRIKTRKVIKDASNTIECNCFAVLDNSKKCVDFTTDGKKRYFCKVLQFDVQSSLEYEDYLTVE